MRKKKLNNKGYMLVEIILASVIAMSIAYYLLNLTYKFKDKNEDVYYSTELISLKNNITKNIMNNLEKSIITDVNYYDEYNITFKANGENRKISLINQDGKISKIKYGKIDDVTNDFDTTDPSYYQKEFASYIEVGKPELQTFNSSNNGILTITIPISSIYDKKNYDIILSLKNENYSWTNRPIIIHYCLNGGNLEEGSSNDAIKDEIIYSGETEHYLSPNSKESSDNVLITRNSNEYFSGWYVLAKGISSENDIYWNGCIGKDSSDNCWAGEYVTNGFGWYKGSDLNSRSYYIGEYYNHKVGYDLFDENKAKNVEKIGTHELWLYACYTNVDTIQGAASNDKYNLLNKGSAYKACNNIANEIDTTKCDNPNYPN